MRSAWTLSLGRELLRGRARSGRAPPARGRPAASRRSAPAAARSSSSAAASSRVGGPVADRAASGRGAPRSSAARRPGTADGRDERRSTRPATHSGGRPALEPVEARRQPGGRLRRTASSSPARPGPRRRVRGVHDLAVADVDADVAHRAVVEHQVAGLQARLVDTGVPEPICAAGRVRQADAGLGPGHHGEAGAVEGVRAGGAVHVGVADLGQRVLHRGSRATGGGHVEVTGTRVSLRLAWLAARCSASSSAEQLLGLGGLVVDRRPSPRRGLLGLRDRVDLALARPPRASRDGRACTARSATISRLLVVVLAERGQLVEERLGVVGEDHLGGRGERLALVLRRRRWPRPGRGSSRCARCWRVEVLLAGRRAGPGRRLSWSAGVVVPLGGLLGLVVERVDPVPDVVDVRLGVARGDAEQGAAEGGDAQGCERAGSALAAVGHERTSSSLSYVYQVS